MDRQADQQTNRWMTTDRWTDKPTDRQMDDNRQTDRPSDVPEADSIKQVGRVDLQQVVALTLECQDSIGSKPNITIHTWSEMNAEKWKVWVRYLNTHNIQSCGQVHPINLGELGTSKHTTYRAVDKFI